MDTTVYIGNELELFQKAVKWKRYYSAFFKPYLKGRVLEVGAGIGGTTAALCDGTQDEWWCIEPDRELIKSIDRMIQQKELPACCKSFAGTLEDIPQGELFDAAMYIDVIEHIEDDGAELKRASAHLKPGGALLIIVPAHQWLYSPFDKAIGHYRRYNRKMLKDVVPADLKIIRNSYLDSVGLMASSANKLFLKQSYPTEKQILFWDRNIVPFSKLFDGLFFHSLGKSIALVAIKR